MGGGGPNEGEALGEKHTWHGNGRLTPHINLQGGLTVGIMLVPQGMAYATLSSLPPIYGLYASTIAGYVYTLFGTSGQLTLGPVALVSLFMSETFTSLGIPLTEKDKDPILNEQAKYHTYVRGQMCAVVSFCAAILLCGMALFRVGSLMKFISPSVLTGFVTGSAVYIFIRCVFLRILHPRSSPEMWPQFHIITP